MKSFSPLSDRFLWLMALLFVVIWPASAILTHAEASGVESGPPPQEQVIQKPVAEPVVEDEREDVHDHETHWDLFGTAEMTIYAAFIGGTFAVVAAGIKANKWHNRKQN